jgi:plastocyanin
MRCSLLAAAACAGCQNTGTAPARDPNPYSRAETVTIDNFSFAPAQLIVPAGATVTWTNHDDVPHTVVANPEPKREFASPALDTDDHFSHTFTHAGTFPYFCSVHPHMTGTVIVR